ncbi:MAG TPA: hypothetical protein VFJ91_05295 [Gaiellaceae bacterium]|nr:hypothetical protein [Gaiellaceae bacterium]
MSALPLADAPALLPAAQRTRAIRLALTAALLGLVALAYLLAPGGDPRALAAGGRGTVVVLDVSGSIDDDSSSRGIRKALDRELAAAGPHGRFGLVLFSDTAFEALPPTAPASAIESYRRFFVPLPKRRRVGRPQGQPFLGLSYPTSPWSLSFTGGTAISSGLVAARAALRRAGMHGGRVVLVSDLADAATDARALRRTLTAYAHDPSLQLVVRMLPSDVPGRTRIYRRLLGAQVLHAPGAALAERAPGRPAPLWLLASAAAVALALAAHELLSVPLRWRTA